MGGGSGRATRSGGAAPGRLGTVLLGSVISGGPFDRLVEELRRRGLDARTVRVASPERWRRLMNAGPLARAAVRAVGLTATPIRLAWSAAATPGVSAVVPSTNPFLLPPAVVATRRLHRVPVVALAYDLYPDALESAGVLRRGGLPSRALEAMNRLWFRAADGIVFIGHRMARHAIARYGEPRAWTVIETGADTAEFLPEALGDPAPRTDLERWAEGRRIVSYVGNMGRLHEVETLAASVPIALEELGPDAAIGLVVAAWGPGREVVRKRWPDDTRIRFEEPLDDALWARLLARSDASLVTLLEEAKDSCVPSKAFSALAAGSPLVAVAPRDSDLGDLVAGRGAGDLVAPGDVDALAAALVRTWRDAAGSEARREHARAVAREFDLARLAERWERFLLEVRSTAAPKRRR